MAHTWLSLRGTCLVEHIGAYEVFNRENLEVPMPLVLRIRGRVQDGGKRSVRLKCKDRSLVADCSLHLESAADSGTPAPAAPSSPVFFHDLATQQEQSDAEQAFRIYELLGHFAQIVEFHQSDFESVEHLTDTIADSSQHRSKQGRPPALVVYTDKSLQDIRRVGHQRNKFPSVQVCDQEQKVEPSQGILPLGKFPKTFHNACVQFLGGHTVDLVLACHPDTRRHFIEHNFHTKLLKACGDKELLSAVLARAIRADSYGNGLPRGKTPRKKRRRSKPHD